MRKVKELIIATKNKGKALEFKELFADKQIQVFSLLDLATAYPDVEETGSTFKENAKLKAEQICSLTQRAVLADDSGLVIDVLNGKPGIYSARYAGIDKNDQANNAKVLHELQDVTDEERTARFVCVLALARPNLPTIYFKGFCEGKIAHKPEGTNGFGYDPIFIPKGYHQTMAQLTAKEKNSISHRSQAMKKLVRWITTV